jgi:hypothetical protein
MKNYVKLMGISRKNWGNIRFSLFFWMEPKIEFDKFHYPAKNRKIEESRVENASSCKETEFFS